MASDALHRYHTTAAAMLAEARRALHGNETDDDPRRWRYLALLEVIALEAIEVAGMDAALTFLWPPDATTYTRRVLVHETPEGDRVVRVAYILEPDPRLGCGMTRVWMGGTATPRPASRMMDVEVAPWTNENAAACSAT